MNQILQTIVSFLLSFLSYIQVPEFPAFFLVDPVRNVQLRNEITTLCHVLCLLSQVIDNLLFGVLQ
jgi:hypothetical protein